MKNLLKLTLICIVCITCNSAPKSDIPKDAQSFINEYSQKYQELFYASSIADWESNIKIIEGDSTNAIARRKANENLANYTGSKENIEKAKQFLTNKDKLSPIQVKQLEVILFKAANNPETVAEIVKNKIKADAEQTEKLFGYDFKLAGKSISANSIDNIISKENNLSIRLKTWEISKEVGKNLKTGLVNLRDLRNKTVQALNYHDFFSYQVSEYTMTTDEMMLLMKKIIQEIWPLYRELHTYARFELAKKYNVETVPDLLPAHWLPNKWGQDWSSMISVEGINLDSILMKQTPEWIVKQGEQFYASLGFPELPKTFWEKSDLYPIADDAPYKKNNHASAWHLNLETDVRSLMSVIPNTEWYETSNHELGHIYYFLTYTNPDIPVLLREGANRAYHEALGSLMGLAAMQKPFLSHLSLLPENQKTDEMQSLLKEAMNYIVFIPWSAGVMTEFEYELYSNNLPENEFNKKWWELAKKYQGIVPPSERGEEYCDAATKTHINDDAAQYYDYAISYVLIFQFHGHISKKILKQDPHATNYYGNKGVGMFIHDIMYSGSSKDWRELLKVTTGEEISARSMLEYFAPLMEFLKKENTGRNHALPEHI